MLISLQGLNAQYIHSRLLSVLLLSGLQRAGVSIGWIRRNSKSLTHPHISVVGFKFQGKSQKWVQGTEFCFPLPKSTGGEVANAQVCKTCIRGFNPRPVLQILRKSKSGSRVSRGCGSSQSSSSLDWVLGYCPSGDGAK